MGTNNFSGSVEDIAGSFFDLSLEEFLHTDFPDEAESLTIFAFGIREICLFRDFTHFRLEKMPDREKGVFELEC